MTKFKRWVAGEDLEHDIYAMESEFELEPTMNTPMYPGNSSHRNNNHDDDLMMIPSGSSSKRARRNLRVIDGDHNIAPAAANNNRQAEVKVIEPESFEESLEIVEYLRANKSVVLNLHHLDTAQSQRVVDFLSGATHAIDGHQQRIGDGVFIFTPHHVNISTSEEMRNNHTMDYDHSDSFWK